MSTLVTIATYEQPDPAYFLKEELEKETIDCFFDIAADRTGGVEVDKRVKPG